MKKFVTVLVNFSRITGTLGITVFNVFLGLAAAFFQEIYIDPFTMLILLCANQLAVVSTFMINDIEDAEEDAKDKKKLERNPISAKQITKKTGYVVTFVTMLAALVIYSYLGLNTFLVGLSIISIGYLYSWRKVRFKTMPPLDLISHAYFLGAGIVLTVFTTVNSLTVFNFMVLSISALLSIEVELKYGMRDFELDKKTNVRTSVGTLGINKTKILRYLNYILIISLTVFLFKSVN